MRSVLLGVLLLAGCATFEAGELPGLEQWPPVAAGDQRVVVVGVEELPEKFVRGWRRGAARVLEASQRFAKVCDGEEPAELRQQDRRVQLVFEHSRSNLWLTRSWMLVCAMSAAVIPARTAQEFGVRAIVSDGSGKQLGVITRRVSGATWVGWLPLLALPFAGAGLGSLIDDTMRSIVVEGVDRGWL